MADVSVEFGAKDTGLEQTLQRIQGELTDLKSKVTSGELSMTELEQTMKRIGQVENMEKRLKAIGGESAAAAPKVDVLGKDLTEMGDKGEQGAKKVEFSLKNVGLAAGVAAVAAKAATAAIDLAFAGVQKTIQSFGDALDMGGRLSDLSERTGVATDKLLLMERAMNNTGVGADSLGPLINKMQKNLVDAADGSSKAADALTELGIPLSSLQSLTPDDQFRRIGRAIADIEDPAKRAAISMEIFGKSGGALNQLFSNLDGELANASRELGVMPAIMAELGSRFDGISDKLAVVQGKFVEFAAGILSKVVPAVEAIATGLANIDAASLGQKLADAFVGAGNAMRGFESAIAAMKVGNLGTAFELVFESIKLQVKETGNSIWGILSAAFKSVVDYIKTIFDPSSMTMTYIVGAFNLIGMKAAASLADSMAKALPQINLFAPLIKGMKEFANNARTDSEALFGAMYHDVGLLEAELTAAGAALPESFDKHLAQSTALFDTQQEIDKINQLTQQVENSTKGVTQEHANAEAEARRYFSEYMKGVAQQEQATARVTQQEREKAEAAAATLSAMREQKLEDLAIAEAKASGNTQLAEQLEKQKTYNAALEEAREKLGMNQQEAQKYATRMADAAHPVKTIRDVLNEIAQKKIDEPVKTLGQQTDDTKGKLKEMAGVLGQDLSSYHFSDVMKKLGLDSFGLTTTQEKIDAINAELKRIEEKPVGVAVDVKQESVKDIEAKIASIGKDPIQTRLDVDKTSLDAALAQTKVEMQNEFVSITSASGGDGGEGGEGGEGGTATLEETIMDNIRTAVEAIRVAVVEKIEPKLPQTALSY